MKRITCMAAALAGLSLANSASAQTWGSSGGVTVALTFAYTAPALVAKDSETGKPLPADEGGGSTFSNSYSVDTVKKVKISDGDGGYDIEETIIKTVGTEEYGSKIATGKWGNADIIKSLVQLEDFPKKGKTPHTAGWSLVVIHGIGEDGPVFCARHTDKTIVRLDDYSSGIYIELPEFNLSDPEGEGEEGKSEARARSSKTVTTEYPEDLERDTTESFTLTESFKMPTFAGVPFFITYKEYDEEGVSVYVDEYPLQLNGLLTGSGKAVLKTVGSGEEKQPVKLYVPGAIKLDKIMNDMSGLSDVGLSDVIEGSISLGAAAAVDLEVFAPDLL